MRVYRVWGAPGLKRARVRQGDSDEEGETERQRGGGWAKQTGREAAVDC